MKAEQQAPHMDLYTPHFGWISYDPQDVISLALRPGTMDDATDGQPVGEARWLLLADRTHPALYWMQCLDDPNRYLPVCTVSDQITEDDLRLIEEDGIPSWVSQSPLIALARLEQRKKSVHVDFSHPILIDPRTRSAFHAAASAQQTLQSAWSDKVESLRECA